MKTYQNILRLFRPINLAIVALTMLVMRYAVVSGLASGAHIGMKLQLSTGLFVLLLFSAVLLTAAGNTINDYFDRKVDLINKPDRVVIGKYVKRRVAIVIHQAFNVLATLFAVIVSFKTSYWWPLLIPILVSALLWWYSPVLKKHVLIGNLGIAICTSLVPVWAVVYEIHELKSYYFDLLVSPEAFFSQLWTWSLVVAAFAFILTLIREVIKDIEDMEGDSDENYRTLPIVYGVLVAKKYSAALLVLFLLGVLFVGWRIGAIDRLPAMLSIALLVILPWILTMVSLAKAKTVSEFHRTGNYVKWLMLGGLILLIALSYPA